MIKELTEIEFKNTFGEKMIDVTESAEALVNIWNYVEELEKNKIVDRYVYENNLVEKVYRNDTATFDHILLPTNDNNVFIIIVVYLKVKVVFGHYKLDLNKKYRHTENVVL